MTDQLTYWQRMGLWMVGEGEKPMKTVESTTEEMPKHAKFYQLLYRWPGSNIWHSAGALHRTKEEAEYDRNNWRNYAEYLINEVVLPINHDNGPSS
jgi:hypothetical protein